MKYIKRAAESVIEKQEKMFKTILVTGARQVGKTTMLKNMKPNVNYITLNDMILSEQAIEEPELFLHPHAKRMLSDILNDFIKNNGGINENQIIITTHSEEFIHNVDIENINVIRKTKNGTKKSRINKENYEDGKELQKLKIELQYKNTEMFFAEKVILVEGEEQILIPNIVKKIYGKNILDNNDISIKIVTFAGTDKSVMLKRTEYGGKCLLLSVNNDEWT